MRVEREEGEFFSSVYCLDLKGFSLIDMGSLKLRFLAYCFRKAAIYPCRICGIMKKFVCMYAYDIMTLNS